MEKQNSMKINQLPSKTWYWLGLNDTKVKWAAGAPCEICAEELSANDEITGFPEAMNTGAGKETDVLFAPEQTKNWSVSAKEGQTKQVTLSIGQGKEKVSSGKIRAAAEEGASLTVFEVFEPAQAAGQLAVRTELYAKKDSRIRLVQVMMRGEGQELLNDVGCICEKNGALDLLQVVVGKGDVYDGIWTELQKDHASLQAEIGYLLQNQQKFDVNLNVRHFGKVTESTIQADGTLSDCCAAAMKGVGNCISDLKLYQKAVQFYFPGADIRCQMTIDLCASVRGDAEANPVPVQMDKPPRKAGVLLDLTDFL